MVLTVLVRRAMIKSKYIFDTCLIWWTKLIEIYFDPKDPDKPCIGAKSEDGTEWWSNHKLNEELF